MPPPQAIALATTRWGVVSARSVLTSKHLAEREVRADPFARGRRGREDRGVQPSSRGGRLGGALSIAPPCLASPRLRPRSVTRRPSGCGPWASRYYTSRSTMAENRRPSSSSSRSGPVVRSHPAVAPRIGCHDGAGWCLLRPVTQGMNGPTTHVLLAVRSALRHWRAGRGWCGPTPTRSREARQGRARRGCRAPDPPGKAQQVGESRSPGSPSWG